MERWLKREEVMLRSMKNRKVYLIITRIEEHKVHNMKKI